MRQWRFAAFGLFMLALGYGLGSTGALRSELTAQEADLGISEETAGKIQAADRALREAAEALTTEGRYDSATNGVNAFLILSGGGKAREDLESGRGVDPETFAALYAGQALPDIQDLLGTDDQGRVTYNNEVVRIYSKNRMHKKYSDRIQILDVGL